MEQETAAERPFDVRWSDIWVGFGVSVAGTAVLTPIVLLIDANVWWVSAAAMVSLAAGGFVAGLRAGQIEPLNGVLIVAIFFVIETAILLVGTALEELEDPLPGLPLGDSTFFFVSPLSQLLAGVLGALLGGWWGSRGAGAPQPEGEAATGSPDRDSSSGLPS